MRTHSKLYENEEEDLYLLLDRDIVLRVKPPHSIEEAIKALEDKNNYGQYISTMRSSKVTDKDVEDYFGPRSVRVREKNEAERYAKFQEENPDSTMSFADWKTQGPAGTDTGPYPVRTKTNYDAFVSQFISKPNLLNYYQTGRALVFPKDKNKGRNEVKNIITTVLTNAKDENGNRLFPEGSFAITMETVTDGKLTKSKLKKIVKEHYIRTQK